MDTRSVDDDPPPVPWICRIGLHHAVPRLGDPDGNHKVCRRCGKQWDEDSGVYDGGGFFGGI